MGQTSTICVHEESYYHSNALQDRRKVTTKWAALLRSPQRRSTTLQCPCSLILSVCSKECAVLFSLLPSVKIPSQTLCLCQCEQHQTNVMMVCLLRSSIKTLVTRNQSPCRYTCLPLQNKFCDGKLGDLFRLNTYSISLSF